MMLRHTLLLLSILVLCGHIHAQNLFKGGFENDKMIGISAGWVSKYWKSNVNGRSVRSDMWQEGKMLHGLQIGVTFQRVATLGYGIHTGLFYEWYTTSNELMHQMGWDRFNEHDLYIPVHFTWRLPITSNFSVSPFVGFAANWAMWGDYKNGARTTGTIGAIGSVITSILSKDPSYMHYEGESYSEYFDYNNHTPHHWNVQAEFGMCVRWSWAQLSFTYSLGLNNHDLFNGATSHENKFNVNLGVFFWNQE